MPLAGGAMRRSAPLSTLAALTAASALHAAPPTFSTPPERDTDADTWVATDAQGRSLPTNAEVGAPRANRTVGIFYFLWMQPNPTDRVYDNTRLLRADPDAPAYGPLHAFHWWGEPHLGYYASDDPFVIARHAQMLSDAGVDVVVFDVTNAFTYDTTYLTICQVYENIRQAGGKTPQIAFIAHSRDGQVAQRLYDVLYGRSQFPDLWYRWRGKPLLLVDDPGHLTPALRAFFTLRRSWAWSNGAWFGNGEDRWPWMDNSPQQPGWHGDPKNIEEISVNVAGHPTTGIGRSDHGGVEPPHDRYGLTPDRAKGLYFGEQWERALTVDPPFVFVTGWNEWIAQRFTAGPSGGGFLGQHIAPGATFFVDEYNEEFSRDIEPMRDTRHGLDGGHGDDYYYQLVGFIRRYKGVRPVPTPSAPRTIRPDGGFAQWATVAPEYRDDIEDVGHRDHPGWGDTHYTDASGRNDLGVMKVARDAKNLYFYARTVRPITAPDTRSNWMTLLLDIDQNHATGWEGYDFAVRRVVWNGKETTVLCRNVGNGWGWTPIAPVPMTLHGRELMVTVPRALLGLPVSAGPLRFDFKWVDNVPDSGNILDFTDHGDAAPNGRFNYRFNELGGSSGAQKR